MAPLSARLGCAMQASGRLAGPVPRAAHAGPSLGGSAWAVQKGSSSLSCSRSYSLTPGGEALRVRLVPEGSAVQPWRLVCSASSAVPTEERSDVGAQAGTVVLVIGGGGREHALCYSLKRSPSCAAVLCAPGNIGMSQAQDAECLPEVDVSSSEQVVQLCRERGVGLVVVGPEAPLVAGLVDDLRAEGIPAFGPTQAAAALEGSKSFMKDICEKYGVPTAKYKSFTDPEAAKQYIHEQGAPIVVKADGLAAGKGVVVAQSVEEAVEAVERMLVGGEFGSAGGVVVVEEFLAGEEASFFAIVDGATALPLASAQDHKAVGDGDTGPNTGGMGAYSPAAGVLTPEMEDYVMHFMIEPTVKGMAAEGCPFTGVLYAGLMLDGKGGVKLLEYNVRFGDPECQVLMMRLQSDLAAALLAAATGRLHEVELQWSPEAALVVVMAAQGYPGSYVKGTPIRGLQAAQEVAGGAVKVFHAGTAPGATEDGAVQVVSVGGRVLGVTARGKTVKEAQALAYQGVDKIDWPQGFCRRDIGWRAVAREQKKSTEAMAAS